MMNSIKLRYLVLAGLLWSLATFATAGSFTPAAGTTISSTSVTVGWTSTASQQWVRAYNASDVKIFDSGRKTESAGTVQFSVAATDTSLRVVFYEKASNGQWLSSERTYPVNIGSSGGATSHDTLASLSCTVDQIAKFNGSAWVCSNDSDTDFLSEAGCAPGEILRATSNEGWECVSEVVESDEICPSEYLSHLNSMESYMEPGTDSYGNLVSITKEVFGEECISCVHSVHCTVDWGYSLDNPDAAKVRHTFRQGLSIDGGLGQESGFSAFVLGGGLGWEIEVQYSGGSYETTQMDSPIKKYFPVTQDQWASCGRMAGCDVEPFIPFEY